MKVHYTIMLFGETDTVEWGEPAITETELRNELEAALQSSLERHQRRLGISGLELQWDDPRQWRVHPLTPEQQAGGAT